jgi:hypothetical protein
MCIFAAGTIFGCRSNRTSTTCTCSIIQSVTFSKYILFIPGRHGIYKMVICPIMLVWTRFLWACYRRVSNYKSKRKNSGRDIIAWNKNRKESVPTQYKKLNYENLITQPTENLCIMNGQLKQKLKDINLRRQTIIHIYMKGWGVPGDFITVPISANRCLNSWNIYLSISDILPPTWIHSCRMNSLRTLTQPMIL